MTQVDWHPYPETSPTYDDAYRNFLLTVSDGKNLWVTDDQWLAVECWEHFLDKNVIAWSELPEPYQPPTDPE